MLVGPDASILDIMSSPDPLNESDGSLVPSSRRVTRSQSTKRHLPLGPSPRKQTFHLDVGNEISPQKLLVTVQTDDTDSDHKVSRRLFQSPTPKRSTRRKPPMAATTTTVPLRGLTDDEGDLVPDGATPRPKRRTRKSGTPMPKRQPTPKPTKTATTRARPSSRSSMLMSDMTADDQATPRASRVRAPAKRKASSPIKDNNSITGSVTGSQPRKRGRPRKNPLPSSELPTLDEHGTANDGEEGTSFLGRSISVASSQVDEAPAATVEEDIWLATLSDQPTPAARRSYRSNASMSMRLPEPLPEREQSVVSQATTDVGQDYGGDDGGYDDYGGADFHSEVGSLASENQGTQERQDTVVAEEFTMISIGSLPSMQPNSSVMVPQEDFGEETSMIINGALESLRQSQRAAENQTSNETSRDERSEATARERVERPRSARNSPRLASPQPVSQSPRRAAKPQSLARKLALKSLQAPAQDSPERPAAFVAPEQHDESAYEDSFSEIPEEILAAATPRPSRKVQEEEPEESRQDVEQEAEREDEQVEQEVQDLPRIDIQPSIERPSTVNHSNPQSSPSRLLTPDETPSPALSSEGDKEKEVEAKETEEERAVSKELGSSPPIPSPIQQRQEAARLARRNSTETPVDQNPPIESPGNVVTLAPPEPQQRPTLSPIVRVGRALQQITSDPPSPPGRDSVLRSPFRSSMPRSSKSPAPPPDFVAHPSSSSAAPPMASQTRDRTWLEPIPQFQSMITQNLQAPTARRPAAPVPVPPMDDPFGPEPAEGSRSESVNDFMRSLGNRRSTNSSERAIAPDDEMSWKGQSTPAPVATEEREESHNSSMYAARGSPVVDEADVSMHDFESDGRQDEMEVEDDEQMDVESNHEGWAEEQEQPREPEIDEDESEEAEDEEEEDDIWAFEAQRPTPTPRKVGFSKQTEFAEPPRRGKIPSPWRKQHMTFSDELRQEGQFDEEFSLLDQQPHKAPVVAAPKQTAQKKVDLSAFFSSPAPLPGFEDEGFGLFKALDAPSAMNRDARAYRAAVSDERHSVPQKSFQPRRDLADSQKENNPFRPTRDLARSPQNVAPVAEDTYSSPEPSYAPIPQKTNFTPRSRQSGPSLFERGRNTLFGAGNSLFGSQAPVFSVPSPTRPTTIQDPSSPDYERPQLKPLPDRATSPTKSCMRSPLKPKTPGRVVEFTSSTLSPLAQAQARAERRSRSPEKQQSETSSEEDKENQTSASDSEAEPQPQPQPIVQQPQSQPMQRPSLLKSSPRTGGTPTRQKLSPTQWSRDHWLRLDQLLQARRQGVLQFQLQLATARTPAPGKKQNAEAQMMLGRVVSGPEGKIVLEQLHLDVIEAFRAEVGGWDDADISRRVFSLIMGEEKRKKGYKGRGKV